MSQALQNPASCCQPCDDILTTTVPGATGDAGAAGTDGTDGVNAFTLLNGGFTMPAEGANVVTVVDDNTWMGLGQTLFIQSAGYMEVAALNVNGVGVTLTNLEDSAAGTYPDNAAAGAAIPNDSKVSPGGVTGPAGAAAASPAPVDATYITQTPNGTLTNEQALSLLATGFMFSTTATGVISTQAIPIPVASGGTGATTAAGARTALGLGTIATQSAAAVALTGGTTDALVQTNVDINSGAIDGTTVGAAVPSTGGFTTLSSTGQRTESGTVVQTPSALQSLLAAGTVNANAAKVRVVGNGAARTLTSTPSITAGVADGQRLLIKGTDAVNTITLQDEGTLPGSTLQLGAATRALGLNSQIELSWDSTTSMWCEISFAAN